YLHLFAKEQPDLNWDNPEVRHEFLRVLTFWCDRGEDGFRIDVSHGLAKDLREPLRDRIDPTLMSPQATDGSDPLWDRDAVHDIYREWRDLFNQYTPAKYAVGESWSPFTTRIFQYAKPDELGAVFDFSM
ncbi:alpha-amylase family glycosyl hydrolase, partial [Bifidobacterium longum]|uniref:alpha-amylase family glycosyl hydrolase n=1 Tax=Bifidobacterium longum TaxID=216816 RepID=UPI00201BB564